MFHVMANFHVLVNCQSKYQELSNALKAIETLASDAMKVYGMTSGKGLGRQ